jgi:dienelactone hydrolase
MDLAPRLFEVGSTDEPEGAVVVLHGGYSRRAATPVSRAQLSVLRMVPIANRIARTADNRLAVFRLLNASRGWSDAGHTPVDDVRWALEEVEERTGRSLPICLVGHSLGGRAALLGAGMPGVRRVVALAPWVYGNETPAGLDGQELLFVHGDRDRVASPARSRALADRLARVTPTTFVTVEGGKHAMLSHHDAFTRPAAEFATGLLSGERSLSRA